MGRWKGSAPSPSQSLSWRDKRHSVSPRYSLNTLPQSFLTQPADLLNARKQISILEDSFGVTQMAGALEHQVTNKDTLLDYIEAAASLRKTTPTLRNDNSSRSHAICRLRFENPSMPASQDGLLYLIDLAGSEAARDKAEHDVTRMKEAREINSSLSVLKDCIRGRALADADAYAGIKPAKKPAYIPFRQSTLTKTLKHVFDPTSARSCKTVVVACVNPCLADIGASKNTLRYAEMLRVAVAKPKAAEYSPGVPATWNNDQLRDWIGRNVRTPSPLTTSFPLITSFLLITSISLITSSFPPISSSHPLTYPVPPPVRRPRHHRLAPRPSRDRFTTPAPARPRVPHPLHEDQGCVARTSAGVPDQVLETAHRLPADRRFLLQAGRQTRGWRLPDGDA